MKTKQSVFILVLCLCFTGSVFGQAVTFHSPVPWITLRDNKIIAKTLIDTSEVKSSAIKLTLSKVENGKKKRISSKKFKTVDYSHEYELAAVDKDILGGKDYLKIEWKVVEMDKKGILEPFGIVKLNGDDPKNSAIQCKKLSGTLNAETVKNALQDKDFIAIGNSMFCAVWNNDKLGLVYKNLKETKNISSVIDGKNGKNAFLSFSDRVVTYYPGNDSLNTVFYKRMVTDTGIQYNSKEWIQDIKKDVKEDLVVIAVPWYDLAILPLDGRIFGFAVFNAQSEKESVALPQTAQKEIPGTWGNMILVKQ